MKKRNKTIKSYEKILRKDVDWDYGSLLVLERHKLKRMFNYFSNSHITDEDKVIAKEISLCIRLLDIVMEEDWASKDFLRRISESTKYNTTEKLPDGTYRLKIEDTEVVVYPRYVNFRNESRFCEGRKHLIQEVIDKINAPGNDINRALQLIELHKESLRQRKALHLYHKIRDYKMFKWWD